MPTLDRVVAQLSPEQRALLKLRLDQRDGKGGSGRIPSRADRRTPFPLSYAQQALWLTQEFYPESSAIISDALVLEGSLDRAAFEKSLNEIVNRHEILRTRFLIIQDQPVQCVEPAEALTIPFCDLCDLPEWARLARVHQMAREDMLRPFDLKRDSLIRAQLIRVRDETHILIVSMHHIVCDGWSISILFSELSVLYSEFASGHDSPLPRPALQYGDFAAWQRECFRGKMHEDKLAYWKSLLADVPVLELPLDRPRPAAQTFRGERTSVVFSRGLADRLKALAERESATLFMTMLAAFQVLLARHSQQHDFAVGTSVAGRNHVELERLIGCFFNLLAIRTNLSGDPSFRELLQRVRESTLGAYDHQDIPFGKLFEEIKPARSTSRAPFFQVTFEFHHQSSGRDAFSGLTVTRLDRPLEEKNNVAKYDLSLVLSDGESGFTGFLLYNADLFEAASIDRLKAHFETLLQGIVVNPDQPISRLPLLTPQERQWFLRDANKPAQVPVPFFHKMFEEQAERTPDAVAVSFENHILNYRELNREANALAHYLRLAGIGPESLVGVFVHRSVHMMVAILGILKSGGAYVPLDPTYPLDRLRYMADDSSVRIVLTEKRLLGSLGIRGMQEIALDSDWDSLIGGQPSCNLPNLAQPHNLAYVIYTSGSTGRPKGVMISHLGIANYVRWAAEAYQASNGRGAVVHSPIGFDMTLTGLFPPLAVGASVELLAEAPGIEPLAQKLRDQQGFSVIKITPAHLELLNRQLAPAGMRGCTSTLVVGADALSAPAISLWRAHARGTRIFNEYGPTETVVGCAEYLVSERTPTSGAVPIGFPISNMQMYVLDPNLEPVPIGVEGELYIGGYGVARGYMNRPDLTAYRFVPDPFSQEPNARLYRTGDACRYIADRSGHIEFLGRLDFQVKLRGFRIELGEIEAALLQYPEVREAVVVEREDQPGDKRLAAYLVVSERQTEIAGKVRDFLKQQLPEYMVPAAFVVMDSLPLTPNGKVDRKALPAPRERSEAEPPTIPPRDALEAKLVEMWEAILNVQPVGVKDNFFEIGGHSLLAERLMAQIRREFGQTIKISAFFQRPTVEKLAALLRGGAPRQPSSSLVALKPEGNLAPFFCVHSLSGDVGIFANLARSMPAERPFYGFQTSHPSELGNTSPSIAAMASAYVDAMIAAQPMDSYHLGGYSFGCVIAFEMAQQLKARGLDVCLLALIDGISPLSVRHVKDRGDNVTFAGIVRDWARMEGIPLSLRHEEIRALPPNEGLEYILGKLKATSLLGPGQDIDWVRRFLGGIAARSRAVQAYSPEVYDGTITLLRSKEADPENAKALIEAGIDVLAPERGWDKLTTKPLNIHFVPGHHATLLQAPQVDHLARELTACLDAAGTVLQP